MASGKSGWGWASTILTIAAVASGFGVFALGKLGALAVLAGAAITGFQESKYQQRQAMKAFKKAFGSIGDSALAGSPTYSWDGPQTVSDVSLPVPLCYGRVIVGGNIINAWTDTVNIYATKWEVITPTQVTTPPWNNYENIIRTDNVSRGIKIKLKPYYFVLSGEYVTHYPVYYKISYKVTGGPSWIVAGDKFTYSRKSEVTIINPERNLYNKQYDIKIEAIIPQGGFDQGSIDAIKVAQYYDVVYSAHENSQDTENVAGHKDVQYLTFALAEGEIKSIDQGKIRLNNNPLNNYGHDYYEFDYTLGSNHQVANPIFDNVVTQNSVAYNAISNDSSPLVVTTQNQDVNALILVLSFPGGLYQITDGKFSTWQVDLTVSYRKVGDSTWIPKTKTIKIKNNNPFKQSIRLDVAEGQYEVKIVKTSANPDSTATFGDVWWIGLQEYVSESHNYPNTAIAYLRIQANEQSSGTIPNALFEIEGKLVEVPKLTISSVTVPYYLTYWNGSNYVLDAEWNGNAAGTVCTDASLFVSQWTDNPIWCLRDLINNDHYGLKSYFQSTLNDTDLRLLAKYCDTKVDNGQGGTEKRFQLDIVIDSQDDARNVIERILSTFRGFAVWAENQFKIKINKAENPVQLFTMGNIIENSLSINYTSATDRFNVAKITYPDRNDANARLSEVMICDVPLGGMERAQTFNLIGVTRRSQAVRMGRFFLNQAKYIKESIQFKAGLDSIACEAGDVIDFSHDVLQYGLASGRIKASTSNSITIDTPISIDTQKTYKVRVMLTDDTIEERTVHNTNSTPPYSLVMTSNFTSTPPVDGIYTFGESGSVTKPYRILSINRDSIQERQITAIEDNASIYSDTGDAVETIRYSSLKNPLQIPDSVTDLTLKELTIDPGDGSKINTVLVSWNPPTIIDNPSIPPVVTATPTGGSIPAGTYYCKYTWIGAGGETLASDYTSIVTTGSTSEITITVPQFPMDVTHAGVYVGTTIGQEKRQVNMPIPADQALLNTISSTGDAIPFMNSTHNASEYDRAKIYLSDSAGAFWEYKGEAKSNFIIENLNKLTYKIAVVSVSLYGIAQSITDASKADITIQGKVSLPSNVSFSGATFGNTIVLTWTPIADKDISFYEIRLNNANWGTVDSNLIYQGLGDKFTLQNPTQTSYTFYIKARDTSGNYSATAGSQTTSNAAPSLGAITVDFTGKDCRLSWTPLYDNDLKEYKVFVYSDSGRTVLLRSESTQDPNYNYTYESNKVDNSGTPIRLLYFTVKAIDLLNQESAQNTSGSNSAPSAPTGLNASNFMEFVYLSWTAVTDTDLIGYNVYVDTVKVAFVAHPSYGHYGSEGVQYNYYIKAVDTFGEGNQSLTVQGTSQGLNIQSTDINDFAITASKLFTKIPVLENDSWTNNSPSAGYVSWNSHQLFYNGVQYNISGDNTNLKYIYWTGGTTYSYSNTNPTLTDAQFIIATNVGGAHDLAWNAIANEVIGSAYIQSLAVQDAHIANLSVGKLTSGSIDAKIITLVRTGAGDCVVRAGKTDFADNTAGFIYGFDYSDADKVKFEIGDINNYIKWNGASLDIKGPVTITGGSGFANLSDRSADNLLDGTTYKKYAATEQTKLSGIAAGATVGATWGVNISGQPTFGNMAYENVVELAKLGTTVVSGGYLQTILVNANLIVANSLSAISATLGTVSAGDITSSTFRTAASPNKRIELSQNTWDAIWYDSSDNPRITIGPVSGTGAMDDNGKYLYSSINIYKLEGASNYSDGNPIGFSSVTIPQTATVPTSGGYFAAIYGEVFGSRETNRFGYGVVGHGGSNPGSGFSVGGIFYGVTADMVLGTPWNISGGTYYKGRTIRDGTLVTSPFRKIAYGIFGSAYGDGTTTPKRGTGFTVTRTGTGQYTINFDTAFAAVPVCLATIDQAGTTIIHIASESTSNCTVTIRSYTGTYYDEDFNFFAIVP